MLRWINSSLNKTPTQESKQQPVERFVCDNIAGQILDMEFKCQSQAASKQLIAQLTKLYRVAVEYYQSNNDGKYRLYQKRMETFLKKQNIDDIIRGKSATLATLKDSAEKKLTHARTKSKNQATRLLQRSQRQHNANLGIIENSIKKQQGQLQQRIQRRKAMSNCSTRTKDDDQPQPTKNRMDMGMILDDIFERKGAKKKVFI